MNVCCLIDGSRDRISKDILNQHMPQEGAEMYREALPTQFAPAERASKKDLERQFKLVSSIPLIPQVLNNIPIYFLALNSHRQLVFANQTLMSFLGQDDPSPLYGKRPGEVLNCIHAFETDGGCGTTEFCSTCGAARAILLSQKGIKGCEECRIIRSGNSEPLEFDVWASPFKIDAEHLTMFSAVDISHEKRRKALERIFFHDILNAAGGLRSITELLMESEPEEIEEFREMIYRLADRLIDEIKAQRELTAAEHDELSVNPGPIDSAELIKEIIDVYTNHEVAEHKCLQVATDTEDMTFTSDKVLLGRVLGNMIKNALEASEPGETVTVRCRRSTEEIEFSVHNPSFMPREIQLQIFQRSFTTKGTGRGLGTYSIKLLTEKYLRGNVSFDTSPDEGTAFKACMPLVLKEET